MEKIILYLAKSILCCCVLVSFYWLFLRNKKFHNYNRFYLLCSVVLGLLVPLFEFNQISLSKDAYDTYIDPVSQTTLFFSVFKIGIVTISTLLLSLLGIRIARLYFIKNRLSVYSMNGINFMQTELSQAPFSFLNNLFWRADISLYDTPGKKIYQHELTHIKQKHTYDKLFSQVVCCIFWINPFYWVIQKELGMVHEFIADAESIQPGDTVSFANMLLCSYNEGRYLNPGHAFFQSPVKRRLMMIADNKQTSFSIFRKLILFPAVSIVILLGSYTIDSSQKNLLEKQHAEKIAAEKAAISINK